MQCVFQHGWQVEVEAGGKLKAAILEFDARVGGLDDLCARSGRQPQ